MTNSPPVKFGIYSGSKIVCCNSNNELCLFNRDLELQWKLKTAEPVTSMAPCEQEGVVIATKDHPLKVYDVEGQLVGSIAINGRNEQFIDPYCMVTVKGNRILAGSQSSIYHIDISCERVLSKISTTPSRKSISVITSQRGIVSAIAVSDEIIAAGTTLNTIGLYSQNFDPICVFPAPAGKGIMNLAWSGCGRYLYTDSRQSNNIHVWDIRETGKIVASLHPREALTYQRLGMHASHTSLYVGGSDGIVRVWNVSDFSKRQFQAHKNPITSITCSHDQLLTTSAPDRNRSSTFEVVEDDHIKIWSP